jgi:hypothetical protein
MSFEVTEDGTYTVAEVTRQHNYAGNGFVSCLAS